MSLRLAIVTPRGVVVSEEKIDRVVLRRREVEREKQMGSEIAVHPSHAPLLVQTPAFELRYERGPDVHRVDVGEGVAEVYRDTVTVLAQSATERTP